jgi:hypothetical protein
VNAAQILQGIQSQSDTTEGLLILGVLLLCIVLLIYVWVKGRKYSEEGDENWDNIGGVLNSNGMSSELPRRNPLFSTYALSTSATTEREVT